jgi:hypothetical protein
VAEYEGFERQDTEVYTGSTSTTDPAVRRQVEPVPLIAGLLFILLAVVLMSGVDLSIDWFGHGVAWILLLGAGVALLVNEVRKARRRS